MKFSCGCKMDRLDWDNIPLNCPAVYNLLSAGLTKGVFQLEKSLGKRWCQSVKPKNIREMADVISLIRPGCLKATFREDTESGKKYSISDTYVAVKDGILRPEYIDSCLEPIFRDTYSVPIYQEQLMKIAEIFAGFNLKEADDLRKGVGKKKEDVVNSLRKKFVDGAIALGRDKYIAEEVFSWIEKFSGYGFNLSHAISYAINGYQTAYAKVHFPAHFFKSALTHARGDANIDKADEVKELIYEARLFNIEVNVPDIRFSKRDFSILDEKTIIFGLGHIKGIGDSAISGLDHLSDVSSELELFKNIFEHSQAKCKFCNNTNSEKGITYKKDVVEALIKSGALDSIDKRRGRILARYKMLCSLTDRERSWLIKSGNVEKSVYDWIPALIESKIPRPLDKRVEKMNATIEDLRKLIGSGSASNIAWEKHYLGMPFSGNEVDMYSSPKANTSCRDFLRLKDGNKCSIAAFLEEVKAFKDKNGNYMAFLRIRDDTYLLDGVVVFSQAYQKFSVFLEEGNIVLISGRRQKGSLQVNSIEAI